MSYVAIKSFPHTRLGQIAKGEPVTVDKAEGERLKRLGLVEYSTKVVHTAPRPPTSSVDAGTAPTGAAAVVPSEAAGEPSSASPAAQASAPTTPTLSGDGEAVLTQKQRKAEEQRKKAEAKAAAKAAGA